MGGTLQLSGSRERALVEATIYAYDIFPNGTGSPRSDATLVKQSGIYIC